MIDIADLERIAAYFSFRKLPRHARTIRAAVEEIREAREAETCPQCKGDGTMFYSLRGMERCEACGGSGRR